MRKIIMYAICILLLSVMTGCQVNYPLYQGYIQRPTYYTDELCVQDINERYFGEAEEFILDYLDIPYINYYKVSEETQIWIESTIDSIVRAFYNRNYNYPINRQLLQNQVTNGLYNAIDTQEGLYAIEKEVHDKCIVTILQDGIYSNGYVFSYDDYVVAFFYLGGNEYYVDSSGGLQRNPCNYNLAFLFEPYSKIVTQWIEIPLWSTDDSDVIIYSESGINIWTEC